ncbi:MAG: FMN-binding protein [Anaerotruncus sp.]|nr:FMN-binding protein [Anaerotruncus sp.]
MNPMVKPIVVLTIICIVSAALLGATYDVTAPLIAQAEKAASDAAMIEVVPGATSFTEVACDIEGVLSVGKDDSGNGFAFKVQDKGFGGAYTIMVGIGPDGKITGAKLMDNSETPGLGSKTGMPDFTSQFSGKDASLEGINTVTGATISSNAFIRCVGKAFEAFKSVGEGA